MPHPAHPAKSHVTGRAPSSESVQGERVLTLTAPEWPAVPDSLRRADGRSVYRPYGATRYATVAQLTMEDQLMARAQERGAPRVKPAEAALLLGADQAELQAQLSAASHEADTAQQITGSGLRLDQAAAAFAVLTGDRRAEILVGPAGSGKTHTAACAAALWRQAAMGEVYGLAVSQAARNVLHEAGVTTADNIAEFLGHLEGRREARGSKPISPRTLLILDEASTTAIPDLAAVMWLAAERDCRVLLTAPRRGPSPQARPRTRSSARHASGSACRNLPDGTRARNVSASRPVSPRFRLPRCRTWPSGS